MPVGVLDTEVKDVWKQTQEILNNELFINIQNGKFKNNFPSARNSQVAHVRPHGIDSNDVNELPVTCKMTVLNYDCSKKIDDFVRRHVYTKQCFWLNNSFIKEIIKD